MVRIAVILVLLISTNLFAQQKELTGADIIRKGLLRAQGTILPGWTLKDGKTNLYLQGDLEYYLQDKVSLKGDISYFLDTQGSNYLKHNHSLFFGTQYHFPYKRFDAYLGLHPGISLIQARNPVESNSDLSIPNVSVMKVSPAVAVATGFNFYVWKYIHFMFNLKYVHAKHTAEWGQTYALDEIRVSFGLGWNVNLLRKK